MSDSFACAHLFVVVVDENKVGRVVSSKGGPWDDGGEKAGVEDGVGMSGHGRQMVRILILSSLIFYPPLNASRALRAGPGQLFLSSDRHKSAREREKRRFADGGRF